MAACPACGAENPERARFCMDCGAALGAPATLPIQERRVVSILFVDLVGFTQRSDRADPEDVRRTLVPYHAQVKRDLERFGGTLDKFIGDAVMGVFGAPVAHEDDPVRAVRAAVRILRSVDGLRRDDPEIAVRVAVNTGEAIVSFGTGPQVGEAIAGDVVNTASRMQSVAPRNRIVIGEATARAVESVFHLHEMDPVAVKGKAEPLSLWLVEGERAARERIDDTPFVGRGAELSALREALQRAIDGDHVEVLTLLGEPGIGKSRLVDEFLAEVQTTALVGRCSPYGEDIALKPIADVLRAIAGVTPSDDREEADRKLVDLVGAVDASGAEHEWLFARLEPILGIQGEGEEISITPRETAAVVGRVLVPEEASPLVVVIEDLHWADPLLLRLIEDVCEEIGERASLFLCTARSDLADLDEAWGKNLEHATSLALPRLSDRDVGDLIASQLSHELDPANGIRRELMERAGGNPLYARELARMFAERSDSQDGTPGTSGAIPDSVQALIAARLDGLPSELRSLVADASVVGTEFWPGPLAEMSQDAGSIIETRADDLVRRGFFEVHDPSSIPGHPQFGFTHALIREVAYGRIPRARRARCHLTAGRWIESATNDRAVERAEALARHYSAAAELATAAGDGDEVEEARAAAGRWLVAAGERAAAVDMPGAFTFFERALGFADPGTADRATALRWYGLCGRRTGKLPAAEVLASYEQALEIERSLGDPEGIGRALVGVGSQLGAMGEPGRSRAVLTEAVTVLSGHPGRELARAWAFRAEEEMYAGHVEESRDLAERALELAASPDTDDVAVMALHIRGDARLSLRDLGGLDDLREALHRSEARGHASDTVTSQSYLAEWLWPIEGPAAGMPYVYEALEVAERRGVLSQGVWTKASALWQLYELGEWEQALRWEREILDLGSDRVDETPRVAALLVASRIRVHTGRRSEALSPEEIMGLARPVEELQVLAPALVVAAQVAIADGEDSVAAELLREFRTTTRDVTALYRESQLAEAARAAARVDELAVLEGLIADSEGWSLRDGLNLRTARAILVEMAGRNDEASTIYADLVQRWRSYGAPFEEAHALAGVARCGGRADPRASELFASLGVAAP